MPFATCIVPVSPMRIEPFHVCEMTSQVLFGEICQVLANTDGGFMKLRNLYDDYEGFCTENQFSISDESPETGPLTNEWVNNIELEGGLMKVPLGSRIPDLQGLIFKGEHWNIAAFKIDEILVQRIALMFLNTPYLWGGRSVFGADCSGFVQSVFMYLHIKLPRDASHQAFKGEPVGFLQEVKCGDLAFFDDPEGDIIHVGILLNETTIIHAYGKVRIDEIDNEGIINTDTLARTHKLRLIKRFL